MDCQYTLSNKKNGNDPFYIEEKRDELARLKSYNELAKTYSSGFAEIEDKNTGEFWDSLNDKSILSGHQNSIAKHRIEIVSRLIPNWAKVLDIGFGSATLEKRLKESRKKLNLSGLDISDLSVKRARKMFSDWTFKKGSILNIPFNRNSFEYVLALEVLEHIKPSCLFRALNEIKRVLVKNGFLIVSVPLNEGLKQLIKEGENPSAHLREYTPDIIKAELELAGFLLVKEKYLFAFRKNYFIKSFIVNFIFTGIRKPNNLIILAQKK